MRDHVSDADRGAAGADAAAVGNLRRHLQACGPHGLLPGVEGAIATIFLKISRSMLGQEETPRHLEGAARLLEGFGDAPCVFC
jgi:hypothetical protein